MMRQVMLIAVCATIVSCTQSDPDPETTSQERGTVEGSQQRQDNKPAPKDDELYAEMVSVLELTDEESANLQGAYRARNEAHSTWMAENGAKLTRLEREMAEAAKARDLSGVKASKAQAEPLRDELRNLLDAHQEAIHAALSAENQERWKAHLLGNRLLKLMEPLDLSEEQVSEVHAQAVLAVQASANESNPEAAGFLQLEKSVEASVLSSAQRQAYEGVKEKNPLRSLR